MQLFARFLAILSFTSCFLATFSFAHIELEIFKHNNRSIYLANVLNVRIQSSFYDFGTLQAHNLRTENIHLTQQELLELTQICFKIATIPRFRQSNRLTNVLFSRASLPKKVQAARERRRRERRKIWSFRDICFKENKENCQESVKIYRKTKLQTCQEIRHRPNITFKSIRKSDFAQI